MKINFSKESTQSNNYLCSDIQLSGQYFGLTSDIDPPPSLRIVGLNIFQSDYIKDPEIRTAIRIKE